MYSKPQLLEAVEQESNLNGIKIFDDIKDKNGNPRFVEGEINLVDSVPSGVTKIYGKWSLSGSHLLIVLCLKLANGTTITNGTSLADFTLPSYIIDKIAVLWGGVAVDMKNFSAYNDSWGTQQFSVFLGKSSSKLGITKTSDLTLSAERNVRISFDLLIDNE